MLTSEQMIQAKKALAAKRGEDISKRIALENHKKAKNGMDLYGIPYRVYFNYLQDRYNNPRNTVEINPCYPLPGYPVERCLEIGLSDFDLTGVEIPKGAPIDEYLTIDRLRPEVREAVDSIKTHFATWHAFDPIWENYFSYLFTGYDFKRFTEFDFFGTTGNCEDCDLDLIRAVYHRLQEKFEQSPTDYKTETDINNMSMEQYSITPYIIVWDLETIRQQVQLEKLLKIPQSDFERRLYMKKYGVDIYAE